jgi:hypothetical protein
VSRQKVFIVQKESGIAKMVTKRWFKRALASLALIGFSLGAHGSVVYSYDASPYTVGRDFFGSAGNVIKEIPPQNSSPIAGAPNATIQFANALAPNSTISIHAEAGGQTNFGATRGGVEGFSVSGFPGPGITSDLLAWATGPAVNDVISVFGYAQINGSVQTDALGHIIDWNLAFTVNRVSNPNFLWIGAGPKPTNFPTFSTTSLSFQFLTSGLAPVSTTINNVIAINGVGVSPQDYTFVKADTSFADPGQSQLERYTGTRGTWRSDADTPVPLPAPFALISFALLGLIGLRVRG